MALRTMWSEADSARWTRSLRKYEVIGVYCHCKDSHPAVVTSRGLCESPLASTSYL